MPDLLADLNVEQRRAVVHAGGPLLIVAGPGSGKTRVVTRRLAYRIESGAVKPRRAVGITFTNRAAQEMQIRLGDLLGSETHVPVGTFHWLCSGILRRHSHRIGLDARFRVLSPLESRQVLRGTLVEAGLPAAVCRAMADTIGAVKNGARLDVWAQKNGVAAESVTAVLDRYRRKLRAIRALDLDDLIASTVELLEDDAQVRHHYQYSIQELVVDEYQDTNPVQRALLCCLAPLSGSTVVVGDEDQAIYGWRQAGGASMRQFVEDYPDATVVRLEESYRSTKYILRAASKLIGHNRERLPKAIRSQNPAGDLPVCFVADTEADEANWIAERITDLAAREGLGWSDFAVLYRINLQARALEDGLVRRGIPYRVFSGSRFYDRSEVRRVVAYLRLALENADDEATAQLVLGLPGIGTKRLAVLTETAAEREVSLLQVLEVGFAPGSIPRSAAAELKELRERVQTVTGKRRAPLRELFEAAVAAVRSELETSSGLELDVAIENLQELQSVVWELDRRNRTLRLLIDRLSFDSHDEAGTPAVSLLTLHSAKGLEFPVVFLPGLEEGILPHRRSLTSAADVEEERRLCYVGITRAQRHLCLSYAHSRLLGGSATVGVASRFISEMGRDNIAFGTASGVRSKPRLHAVAIGESLRHSRWGVGTVVDVEAGGRDTLVTIVFESVGRQRVQLCHAPLSRVGSEGPDVLAG